MLFLYVAAQFTLFALFRKPFALRCAKINQREIA